MFSLCSPSLKNLSYFILTVSLFYSNPVMGMGDEIHTPLAKAVSGKEEKKDNTPPKMSKKDLKELVSKLQKENKKLKAITSEMTPQEKNAKPRLSQPLLSEDDAFGFFLLTLGILWL